MNAVREILNTLNEGRPGAWVIQSLGGYDFDEIYGNSEDGIAVVVEFSTYGSYSNDFKPITRRIAIFGAGKEGSYGPVGSKIQIDIDRNANYRPVGDPPGATIIGYCRPTNADVKKLGTRSYYHFD